MRLVQDARDRDGGGEAGSGRSQSLLDSAPAERKPEGGRYSAIERGGLVQVREG
jgi:hypothetical protein